MRFSSLVCNDPSQIPEYPEPIADALNTTIENGIGQILLSLEKYSRQPGDWKMSEEDISATVKVFEAIAMATSPKKALFTVSVDHIQANLLMVTFTRTSQKK